MQEVRIYEMEHCSEAVAAAVNRLLQQLGGAHGSLSGQGLLSMTAAGDTHLFLLEAEDGIAAMATLAFYASPTGRKAWIEDVVVDELCRGRGFGRLIVQHAIDFARRSSGSNSCSLLARRALPPTACMPLWASSGARPTCI